MNHEEEMREIEARTTPGQDPQIEQAARQAEPEHGEEHPAARREEAATHAAYDRGPGSGDTMLAAYRSRFTDAQARFIDDPKGAVEEARSVLEEAIDRFMDSLHEAAGDGGDTERMRVAMRRYRDVFDRLADTNR